MRNLKGLMQNGKQRGVSLLLPHISASRRHTAELDEFLGDDPESESGDEEEEEDA